MSFLYAFMCLSAWYVCLTAPMRGQSWARSMGTLGAASALASGVWALLGEILAVSLDAWMTTPGLGDHYLAQAATVFVIGMLLYLLAAAAHYVLIAVDEHREAEKR